MDTDLSVLLSGISAPLSLKASFEQKLAINKESQRAVELRYGIEHKSLDGLLNGTAIRVDYINMLKLSLYLGLNANEVRHRFLAHHEEAGREIDALQRITYIYENFPVNTLRKEGFIEKNATPEQIEARLLNFFGLTKLEEYDTLASKPAFCVVRRTPSEVHRDFWVKTGYCHLAGFENPRAFNRPLLVELIPKIKPYSMKVRDGLATVVRALYAAGVTVSYQPRLPGVAAKAATFALPSPTPNALRETDRFAPGILLSDYGKRYATLWVALLHELHHVLYDWEDIARNRYHLSDEADLLMTEQKADEFARDYWCAPDVLRQVINHLDNETFIRRLAQEQRVHPSVLYFIGQQELRAGGDESAFRRYIPGAFTPSVADALNLLKDAHSLPLTRTAASEAPVIKKRVHDLQM